MADFLSGVGEDKEASRAKGSLTLAVDTAVGKVLDRFIGVILENADKNYRERIRTGSRNSIQDIRPVPNVDGSNVGVQIYGTEHLDFIDQGVTGVGFGEVDGVSYQGSTMYRTVHNGKFRFRNLNISRSMVDSLQEWIKFAGMSIPAGVDPRQFAIMIAKNIKRRGIKPTMFFTDAVNEVSTKELEKELGQVMNREITVELKEVFRQK